MTPLNTFLYIRLFLYICFLNIFIFYIIIVVIIIIIIDSSSST